MAENRGRRRLFQKDATIMKLFSKKYWGSCFGRSAQAAKGLAPLEHRRMKAKKFATMNDPFVDETLMVTDADLSRFVNGRYRARTCDLQRVMLALANCANRPSLPIIPARRKRTSQPANHPSSHGSDDFMAELGCSEPNRISYSKLYGVAKSGTLIAVYQPHQERRHLKGPYVRHVFVQ